MNIYMSPHGGCFNHGCEAIVRSTADMLGFPKDNLFLYTSGIESDLHFGLNNICTLVENNSNFKNISLIQKKMFALRERISGVSRDIIGIAYRNKNILLNRNAIWLSIGGDNYCYTGMQHILSEQSILFSYYKLPKVLWGCSIEESVLSEKTVNELKGYSLITVRESLSHDILIRKGVSKDLLVLCSDPAFTLKMQKTNWNESFLETQPIGINISALMGGRYDAYDNATYNNFKTLIRHILDNTKENIILIPHVRQAGNDDLVPSLELAKEFSSDRILVADEDFNCMELKYIISKCKMFIGCRTHSTIAAYSTCVPTLVVGYSTKAKGIAKDIFGDYNDLLVDAREFKSDNDLLDKFLKFDERKGELKDHLERFMPEYINRAYLAKEALLKII